MQDLLALVLQMRKLSSEKLNNLAQGHPPYTQREREPAWTQDSDHGAHVSTFSRSAPSLPDSVEEED